MVENEHGDLSCRVWGEIPNNVRKSMLASWENGVPPTSLAIYGRWWQLETWLRDLVYVELRSKLGSSWASVLPPRSESRQIGEENYHYMATPDLQNRLAYADASILFKLTQDHADIFERLLLPGKVWAGRIDELCAIRNRMSHCRRSHPDDLIRIEQTLRDLEVGAFSAISAFNNESIVGEGWGGSGSRWLVS